MFKRLSRPRFAAAALAVAAVVTGLAVQPGHAQTAKAAKLSPPVIREKFTLLPCPKHPKTTLDMEGCAEHAIVRADASINHAARTIFAGLQDDPARQRFIDAQTAWQAFRDADCASESDLFEGGTLASVVAANCSSDRTAERLKELRAFVKESQQDG
jgi:uncharacterized protein YecT (DUF1311 family)